MQFSQIQSVLLTIYIYVTPIKVVDITFSCIFRLIPRPALFSQSDGSMPDEYIPYSVEYIPYSTSPAGEYKSYSTFMAARIQRLWQPVFGSIVYCHKAVNDIKPFYLVRVPPFCFLLVLLQFLLYSRLVHMPPVYLVSILVIKS